MTTVESSEYKRKEQAKLIILLIVFSILSGGIFAHGIYLEHEFILLHFIVGWLTIFTLPILSKSKIYKINELDIFAAAVGTLYTISVLNSANVSMALNQALRIWTYILYYIILSNLFVRCKFREIFIKGIIFIGVANTLFGLATVVGWVDYTSSWTDVLSSTFQYHNAYATFLIPLILFAGFYSIESSSVGTKTIYQVCIFILSMGLAGSQSRGGYLVFLIVLFLFFMSIGLKQKSQFTAIIATIVSGFVLWDKFVTASNNNSTLGIIMWLLLGTLLSLLYIIISTQLGKHFISPCRNSRKFSILGLLVVLIILIIITLQFADSNGDVINRIKKISLNDHSVEERIVFYMDALRMVADRPLLGFGGGGWAAAYQKYQSYLYYSTEPHGILVSVAVETGIFGLIVFLLLIATILRTVVKNQQVLLKRSNSKKDFNVVVGLAFFAILVHSLVDFNLSKGAISLLFWAMAALVQGINREVSYGPRVSDPSELVSVGKRQLKTKQLRPSNEENRRSVKSFVWLVGLVGAGLVISSSLMLAGIIQASKAVQIGKDGDYNTAIKLYKLALRYYPLESKNWADLASIHATLAVQKNDRENIDNAKREIEKAIWLNRYDPNVRTAAISVMSRLGEYEKAYEIAKETVSLAPFHNEVYESFGQAALNYSMDCVRKKNKIKARFLALEVLNIQNIIEEKISNLDPLYRRNWIVEKKLEVTTRIQLLSAKAKVMLGDDSAEQDLLRISANEKEGLEAKTWLMALAMVNEDQVVKDNLEGQLSKRDVINAQLVVPFVSTLK